VTAPLVPTLAADDILPADAAYFARTDLATTVMVGFRPFNVESVTLHLQGLLGSRPAVRHICGATDEILATLRDAGLQAGEETLTYGTGAEAEALAASLLERGHRFVSAYPLPPGRWPDAAQVVPPTLWGQLNAKSALADLVPPAHLPHRDVMPISVARRRAFGGPVWVKAGGPLATGCGYAVRRAADAAAYVAALEELAALGDTGPIVVEEDVHVATCWAIQLGITDRGAAFGGASEQVFASPGRQSGNLVDTRLPFPAPELAIAIGDVAHHRGFRGFAGLDIGQAVDGRLVVFDPNFRFTASTAQAMLTPAAAARSGLAVSMSVEIETPRRMQEIIGLIRGPVADGWFVPTRLIDAALLPVAEGLSRVSGFTLGQDRAGAEAARERLRAMLVP
jgi:hypothetical protein